MTETILTIAAHNDDQVIGAGGTLAKYAGQGKNVRTIVMSLGEFSHPHLKREVIVKRRVRESVECDRIIGGRGLIYFDLKEGNFTKEFAEKNVEKKLAEILNKEKPTVIFTHGHDDLHPDHHALYKLVMKMIDLKKITCPVYSFDIWSLLRFRKRNLPKMVVDVSDTFTSKVKALLAHKSQKLPIGVLMWRMVLKDWFNGLVYGYKYAEVFYKIK